MLFKATLLDYFISDEWHKDMPVKFVWGGGGCNESSFEENRRQGNMDPIPNSATGQAGRF